MCNMRSIRLGRRYMSPNFHIKKILILQIKTVRLREVKTLMQSYTGIKKKHTRKLVCQISMFFFVS